MLQHPKKKAYQRNLKNYTRGSNVASNAWQNNHSTDFKMLVLLTNAITAFEKHWNPGPQLKSSTRIITPNRCLSNAPVYCISPHLHF